MIIKKHDFYRSSAWKKRRKEILVRDGGACVQCGGITRLIVHHIRPIKWINGQVQVENINELLECPLETLCIYCHNQKERAKDESDEIYIFLRE